VLFSLRTTALGAMIRYKRGRLQMTAYTAMDHSVHDEPSGSRESGIVVRVAEREASPVASAVELGKNRDDEINVDTDEGVAHAERGVARGAVAHAGEATIAPEDAIIEVGDDEIETADPALSRQTMPSPSSALDTMRSRPPARPSLRPRSTSPRSSAPPYSSALPPPSRLSLPPSANGRAAGIDPWLLANKTLELSRANSRIVELEEQLAYREAAILDLQEQLAKARRKLGEAQPAQPLAAAVEAAHAPTAASEASDAAGEDEGDEDFGDDADRESDLGNTPIESLGVRGATPEEDLQQITGIGPRFEAALRKQGITRLSQIAAWSEADVRQVAKALRIPKSRIVKGGWVEAARQAIGTRAASE
jgi:predicted flap endonuclease-1-like 5' DNA nuclease